MIKPPIRLKNFRFLTKRVSQPKSKSFYDSSFESELKHDVFFSALRKTEFSRLDDNKQVYLDYTGGNLYGQSQLKKHFTMLSENIYGNPYSTNPSSNLSTRLIEKARSRVIDYFNADEYFCIFTQNASAALKIVGECYPFSQDSYLLLLLDNHNSVNGIRLYCTERKGHYSYVPLELESLSIAEDELDQKLNQANATNKLFAFPAQSNVSGVRHDLSWISRAHDRGWDVLLDAAAYVPTSRLDLSTVTPDFVTLSFYKLFGYPTGLGCLLVRKEKAFHRLKKRWFAGGTVTLASAKTPYHFLQENHEKFENGTLNYLDIPAITIGLDFIDEIGINRIQERVESLRDYLEKQLKRSTHSNGQRQVVLFASNARNKGGTIMMSFRNPNGSAIPFEKIQELANQKNISIRSGCFCNPGLDETTTCLQTEELIDFFKGRKQGIYEEMIYDLQKMRGAVRVSLGLATTKNDLDSFLCFVESLKNKML